MDKCHNAKTFKSLLRSENMCKEVMSNGQGSSGVSWHPFPLTIIIPDGHLSTRPIPALYPPVLYADLGEKERDEGARNYECKLGRWYHNARLDWNSFGTITLPKIQVLKTAIITTATLWICAWTKFRYEETTGRGPNKTTGISN